MCVFGCDVSSHLFFACTFCTQTKPKPTTVIWAHHDLGESDSSVVALASTDADGLFNIGNKDFTIANFA